MDTPKVLKRTITPDIRASRERDMEAVLDNYRENLRDHGVTDEAAIERFVSEERDKIQQEYESLNNGDCLANIYHTSTDWEGIASEMKQQEAEEEENGMSM
jgi:hypothetical protein